MYHNVDEASFHVASLISQGLHSHFTHTHTYAAASAVNILTVQCRYLLIQHRLSMTSGSVNDHSVNDYSSR